MDSGVSAEGALGNNEVRALALAAGFSSARTLSCPEGAFLVCALPYGNQFPDEAGPKLGEEDALIAPFARYNYYREAVRRLQKIASDLRRRAGGEKADFRIFCNSPIPEKPIAVRASLGVYGKNSLIITKEAGSLVVLAMMSLPFEKWSIGEEEEGGRAPPAPKPTASTLPPQRGCPPATPPCVTIALSLPSAKQEAHKARCTVPLRNNRPSLTIGKAETACGGPRTQARDSSVEQALLYPLCQHCEATNPPCAAACPTGAIHAEGGVELSLCIQWYASGNGDSVPEIVRRAWGRRLYGCTNCQDACPHNQRAIAGVKISRGRLGAALNARALLSMSDAEIKSMFKGTAMGHRWLPPLAIRRNATLALNAN
ncbi:MAG: hypothetical protein LBT01_05435 [Spirochaetaceae bacterium]|jgi:epoxyqueuosine reductase QueG|nr:hypothetical protein [Spirochaetaceae bacterium]